MCYRGSKFEIWLKIKVASLGVDVCPSTVVCRAPSGAFICTLLIYLFVVVFLIQMCLQQQCPPSDLSFNFDANKQQRQLIAELENKNR